MNNFNVQRELAEQRGDEWQFGALSQPGIVSIPLGERDLYLPLGETQFDQFTDFQDCASRSPVNHLEALFTYHYQHEMKSENKAWLEVNGYVENNKVTFSDRFVAVLSGTTHDGNSLKAPLETIRKRGLIPKSLLPKTDTMTWTDYYAPIPQYLTDLGKEFLKRFTINYEQVAKVHFADIIKDDCIGVAGYAWPAPLNGIYPKTTGAFNHAFLLYSIPEWEIFDNYTEAPGDFTKTLAPDYTFFDWGYRMYVSAENVVLKEPTQSWTELFTALLEAIKRIVMPPPPTPLPSNSTPTEKLYYAALGWIGEDASPKNLAPQELSCAEGVSNILHEVYPDFPEGILSTSILFTKLKESKYFKGILEPIKGCVVVSPRTSTTAGHTGIYMTDNVIASNDSRDGLFKENYTRSSWRREMVEKRKLKTFLFLPV